MEKKSSPPPLWGAVFFSRKVKSFKKIWKAAFGSKREFSYIPPRNEPKCGPFAVNKFYFCLQIKPFGEIFLALWGKALRGWGQIKAQPKTKTDRGVKVVLFKWKGYFPRYHTSFLLAPGGPFG